MDVPSPERCSRLTAHKAFPKRRLVTNGSSSDDLLQTRSRRSYTSPTREARITSWIRDASPNLPLTPPDDSENAGEAEDDGLQEEETVAAHTFLLDPVNEASGSTTPVNHQSPLSQSASIHPRSPPTPEMTPPKKIRDRKRSPSPPLRHRKRTSLSPPPTSRQTSSKAESFRTAAEQLSSPSPPPASLDLRAPVLTFHSPSPPREHTVDSFGLGIGYSDDDSVRTPTKDRPTMLLGDSPQSGRIVRSDPTSPASVDADSVIAAEPSAVLQLSRGRDLLGPSISEADILGFSYINEDDTPYKERPFFDDDAQAAADPAPSEGSKRSVSPISDGFDDDEAFLAKARRDSKRVSQISNLSMLQPVEVVLIDLGPVTPPKLRHASKIPSLRAASSSKGGSARSSLQSNSDYKPRLNRMLERLPNITANSSLFSDSGISMAGSDHVMKRWSKLAVTDIPRRPSMTHSLQHHTGPKDHSVLTNPSKSRPATAPSAPDASPELRSMRRRTVSTASSNSRGRGRDKGTRRERPPIAGMPPVVPRRTSSLGAPTSRDVSMSRGDPSNVTAGPVDTSGNGGLVSQLAFQAQSLPREPLARPEIGTKPITETKTRTRTRPDPVNHTRQMSHQSNATSVPLTPVITLSPTSVDDVSSPMMPLWVRRSSDTLEGNALATATGTPRRNSKEDAALLASRALLKTPFSGHSVQSSLSGAYEVHEATAISIYPHTNSSLLVVQQAVPNVAHFPAHPGVRPGAYRVTEVSSPTSTIRAQQPESVHVKIEGPDSPPSQGVENKMDSPTLPYDSPLRNPRPAPKAPTSEAGTLPSVKLIPPTPLDMPDARQRPATNGKAAPINGPVSLVRRALSSTARNPAGNTPRASGLWLGSGRKHVNGGVKKKRSRAMIKDDNLSPFWRPKKFWDDEEDYADDTADGGEGSSSSSSRYAMARGNVAPNDYFSQPVRNTLGFPQSRIVITGPVSLARRLSSIRRHRSLKAKKLSSLAQPVRPVSPSLPARPAPKPSSTQRRSSLPRGASSISPVRVISPTPSAMARRRRSQKRSVRFEFNPMRGLSGSSGETPGWATRAMRRRKEKQAAKRREELKGTIGQPKLETVFE